MTLGHFLYIPGVLCLGLLIGYILGGRAAAVARADQDLQARRRAARQAARQAEEAEEVATRAAGGPSEAAAQNPATAARGAADKPPAP